jgi:hypothetical protein
MHANWLFQFLAYTEMAGLVAVIFAIIWKRQLAAWPSLFAAISLELSTDVSCMILMHLPGHYSAYFFTYWISAAVQSLLRLWMIADIMRSFPGLDFIPAKLYLFFGIAGATMAATSAAYCWHIHSGSIPNLPTFRHVQDFYSPACIKILRHAAPDIATLINRCVSIAWASFTIVMLLSIKLLRFGWSETGARIANGVFVRLCFGLVIAEMIAVKDVKIATLANGLDSLVSIGVFCCWAHAIIRSPGHAPKDIGQTESVENLLQMVLSREG